MDKNQINENETFTYQIKIWSLNRWFKYWINSILKAIEYIDIGKYLMLENIREEKVYLIERSQEEFFVLKK